MSTAANQEFIISRIFDAPRDLVWDCFSNPERLKEWWSPKGFEAGASKMDFRPGGTHHYSMTMPDGNPLWGILHYKELHPKDRMVFIQSFSDAGGGKTRHPMSPTWPLEMQSIYTFEDLDGKTKFTVHWTPYNPTEEEKATFAAGHDSMNQGWGGTLDKLAEYLEKA